MRYKAAITNNDSMRLEQVFAHIKDEFRATHNGPPVEYRVAVEGQARPLHPVFLDEVYRIGREAILIRFAITAQGRSMC